MSCLSAAGTTTLSSLNNSPPVCIAHPTIGNTVQCLVGLVPCDTACITVVLHLVVYSVELIEDYSWRWEDPVPYWQLLPLLLQIHRHGPQEDMVLRVSATSRNFPG